MTKLTSQLEIRLQDKVSGAAKKAAQSLSGVTRAMKETNAAPVPLGTRLDASLHRVNSAMAGARMGMFDAMAGVYALNRTFGASVRSAGNFEESIKMVGVLSGASAEEVAKLSEQAKELGRTTEFTSNQAAQAQRFLAMAGFDSNEIYGALPSTLQLASAASMDLASAADVASNVLTGYSMTTDELAHANDVMVTAFTSANTNLQDLGQALKYAGPVASSAGVSFEEASAALAMMGNAGIQSTMAGTGLRGAITRMLGPTNKMQKAMDKAGLKFTDANGRLLPLSNIIAQLEPYAEDTGLMMELFGQRAGPAMMALVSQGSDALKQLTYDMENSGGAAQNVADVKMSGFNGQMRKLKSAADGLGMAIGTALIPGLQELAEKLTAALGPITEFAAAHPDLIANVGMAAGALVGFKLATAAARFATLGLGSGVLTMARGLVGLPGALGKVTGAMKTLALVSATNPIGLIGLIAASAAILIYRHWDQVSAFFQGFWEGIRPYIEPLQARFDSLLEPIRGVVDALGSFFATSNTTAEGLEKIKASGEGWGDFLGPAVRTSLELGLSALQGVAEAIEAVIEMTTRLLSGDLFGAGRAVGEGFIDIAKALFGEDIFGRAKAVIDDFTSRFSNWWSQRSWGDLLTGDIFSGWTSSNNAAAEAVKGHTDQLAAFSGQAAGAVEQLKKLGQVERNKVKFDAENQLAEAGRAQLKLENQMSGWANWGFQGHRGANQALKELRKGEIDLAAFQSKIEGFIAEGGGWQDDLEAVYKLSFKYAEAVKAAEAAQRTLDNIAEANARSGDAAEQAAKSTGKLADANAAVSQSVATTSQNTSAPVAEAAAPQVPSMKPSEVQALESKIAKVRAAAAELPGVVKGALQQATQVMDSQDWTIHGEKLMETLVAGVRNKTGLLKQEVEKALAETRKLLPSSDAKEGPLSSLTANGAAIIETLAKGVRQGGSGPLKGALAAQLSGVSGPQLIGASRSSGASPGAGSARAPVNVTVNSTVNMNGSSADASQIGQEVARHIREQVQEAFRGLHADTGMRFA